MSDTITCDRCGNEYSGPMPRAVSKESWMQILKAPDDAVAGLIREAGDNVCPSCIAKSPMNDTKATPRLWLSGDAGAIYAEDGTLFATAWGGTMQEARDKGALIVRAVNRELAAIKAASTSP